MYRDWVTFESAMEALISELADQPMTEETMEAVFDRLDAMLERAQ